MLKDYFKKYNSVCISWDRNFEIIILEYDKYKYRTNDDTR